MKIVDACLITRYVFKVKACLPQGCFAFALFTVRKNLKKKNFCEKMKILQMSSYYNMHFE